MFIKLAYSGAMEHFEDLSKLSAILWRDEAPGFNWREPNFKMVHLNRYYDESN